MKLCLDDLVGMATIEGCRKKAREMITLVAEEIAREAGVKVEVKEGERPYILEVNVIK